MGQFQINIFQMKLTFFGSGCSTFPTFNISASKAVFALNMLRSSKCSLTSFVVLPWSLWRFLPHSASTGYYAPQISIWIVFRTRSNRQAIHKKWKRCSLQNCRNVAIIFFRPPPFRTCFSSYINVGRTTLSSELQSNSLSSFSSLKSFSILL